MLTYMYVLHAYVPVHMPVIVGGDVINADVLSNRILSTIWFLT